MAHYSYTPKGVCTRNISFNIENGCLFNLKFDGGCAGNLQAVAKLVEGQNARDVALLLKGNDCRGKGTSCADQLAQAIFEALKQTAG